ncbi:MAG: hypothetical protein LBH34_00815 [Prevotellaceae bacterium]|nr:hypothetical protein [Prevotellaceae bacterium]
MASSYSKKAPAPQTIEFTLTPVNNAVTFRVRAQSMVVDRGDGSTDIYFNLDFTEVSHTYADNTEHNVRIQSEELSHFGCNGELLTVLNVSNCPTLTELWCTDNQLSELDFSSNMALTQLFCSDNQLSTVALDDIFTDLLDQSNMEGFASVSIGNNPGTETCNRGIAAAKKWYVNDDFY